MLAQGPEVPTSKIGFVTKIIVNRQNISQYVFHKNEGVGDFGIFCESIEKGEKVSIGGKRI